MSRTLLSGIIGFFSFFAFFLGSAAFEVPGENSIRKVVAGCIALILYMVLGQFLLPRDPDADTTEDWRVRACMAAPLVPIVLLILVTERISALLGQAVPMLAAGCIGVFLGGILARSLTRFSPLDAARASGMSRLLGNTGAAFYISVSVILFVLAAPALEGPARGGTMAVAVLHVVLAAAVLWRIRKGKTPIFAAMFGFLMALLLAGIGASYMAHGPAMRLASIAHFVCAAMDMVVCACCVGVAILRWDVRHSSKASLSALLNDRNSVSL